MAGDTEKGERVNKFEYFRVVEQLVLAEQSLSEARAHLTTAKVLLSEVEGEASREAMACIDRLRAQLYANAISAAGGDCGAWDIPALIFELKISPDKSSGAV